MAKSGQLQMREVTTPEVNSLLILVYICLIFCSVVFSLQQISHRIGMEVLVVQL